MKRSLDENIKGFQESRVRPLLLTIPQVMECMGLGRNKVYDLIQREGLPVLRFGRAVRVSYAGLERWLEQREENLVVR